MISTSGKFDTFNAKHRTAKEVAETFVNPPTILNRLVSKNHVVMTGPRGSGKTTLLKMLTVPALANWAGEQADAFKEDIDFVSIFVPADRSWHGQIKELSRQIEDQETAQILGNATFTTHIFKAISKSFFDWQALELDDDSKLSKTIPKLSFQDEKKIVSNLSEDWLLEPEADTFFELNEALARRLSTIGLLKNKAMRHGSSVLENSDVDFLYLPYREGIKRAYSLHNNASSLPDRRWFVMFDELEVAPSGIQQALLQDLRGSAEEKQILYKLALAPYNRNFVSENPDTNADNRNDYHHIDLTFPRKKEGHDFSARLCRRIARDIGLEGDPMDLLGASPYTFEEDDGVTHERSSAYSAGSPLGEVFLSLARKDPSFATYLERKKIDFEKIGEMSEVDLASSLRKVRNIVIVRDYFTRAAKSGFIAERLSSRSRKSYQLYAGMPSILTLTEGNPRALINLLNPIFSNPKAQDVSKQFSMSLQAEEIDKSIRVMRSLLKAIPSRDRKAETVLGLLDKIGAGFYAGLVSTKFKEQPPLSFRVDRGQSPDVLHCIGKAVNLGALIYVPDQGSEEVMSTIMNKRFRLNYLLAAYYKLPISLDRELSLTELLNVSGASKQGRLDV